MRVGLQIPRFNTSGGTEDIRPFLSRVASAADAGGMYSIWVMDHFFQIRGVGPEEDPMLEAYTTLGYLAGLTKNVKLGTMVTGVIYRYPGLLVKTATTLDVLSGGRAYLGIGAAWNDSESQALGVPFPSTKVRFEMLEEALQIAHQMWAEKVEPYAGKHYQLGRTLNHPQAISKPHPPILIGGMGEEKTMRLIAKYGDACNFFAYDLSVVKAKLDILKQRCDEVNRPYEEIEKTSLTTVDLTKETVAEVVARAKALADLGIQHFIFNSPELTADPNFMDKATKELIPALNEI